MRLVQLPYTYNPIKRSTVEWAGLNRRSLIADNQLSDCSNLSTKQSPLISPRPSRAVSYTLTSGTALFPALKLCWVDGTDFLYDNVDKGNVTAGSKSMVDFNGKVVIFPDKVAYDYVADSFAAFGAGVYPVAGSVPDIDYACELDNRIWGVKGDNIYCNALGDYDDWTSFLNPDGSVNDAGAWSVDTGTNGDFTGIVSYKGANIAFKRDCVWKRFGNVPSDFQFVEISRLGCTNNKSICEVNNILFWLSPQGIVAYTGGVPEVISEDLNDNYVSGVAGGDGRRYYISLYNGSTYALYVYDTWKNAWLQEDNLHAIEMAYFDGSLYALASDNKIYEFGSGTEKVSWYATTKDYTEQANNKKVHSELSFRVDLETGSTLSIYVKEDNGVFRLVKTYATTNLTSFNVAIKPKRCDHFAVKMVGSGEGIIHEMTRKFYAVSEY
ncbi:MAG: hypothetical protein ABFD25_03300 [Clostridiaceae bacterium]